MFLVPSLVSFRLFSPPCIQTRTQKHVCSVVKELPLTSRKNHMSNIVISLRGVTQPLSKWRVFFLNKVPSTVTKCLQMWEKLSFLKNDVLRCHKQDFITKASRRAVVLPPRGLGHIGISARRRLIKAPTQQKHIEDMLKIMVFTLFSLKSRSNLVTQGSSWKCLWASIYCLNE